MLTPTRKDAHRVISVIYHFKCKFDDDYIRRTGRGLKLRMNQHAPAKIQKENCNNLHKRVNTSGSAIAEHLLQNRQCDRSYSKKRKRKSIFLTLWKVQTFQLYLCKQKRFRHEYYQPLMVMDLIYTTSCLLVFSCFAHAHFPNLFAVHIFLSPRQSSNKMEG